MIAKLRSLLLGSFFLVFLMEHLKKEIKLLTAATDIVYLFVLFC